MITARDLHYHLRRKRDNVNLGAGVDKWLKDIVFPSYSHQCRKFFIPFDWNDDVQHVEEALQRRGFSVRIDPLRNGRRTIELVIPPQGD